MLVFRFWHYEPPRTYKEYFQTKLFYSQKINNVGQKNKKLYDPQYTRVNNRFQTSKYGFSFEAAKIAICKFNALTWGDSSIDFYDIVSIGGAHLFDTSDSIVSSLAFESKFFLHFSLTNKSKNDNINVIQLRLKYMISEFLKPIRGS